MMRGQRNCPTFTSLGLWSWLVTGEDPGVGHTQSGGLQDLITEVQDVDPVEQLTLSWRTNDHFCLDLRSPVNTHHMSRSQLTSAPEETDPECSPEENYRV